MGVYRVKYMVPVWATVDTDEHEVTAVNVADEETGEPLEVMTEAFEPVPDGLRNAEATLASDIAESEEWPAWEFGW